MLAIGGAESLERDLEILFIYKRATGFLIANNTNLVRLIRHSTSKKA